MKNANSENFNYKMKANENSNYNINSNENKYKKFMKIYPKVLDKCILYSTITVILSERRSAQMIETIFVCSVVTTILNSCVFIYTLSNYSDNKNTAKKIIKLSKEVQNLRTSLSEERRKRIEAEANAAFFQDHFYEDTKDLFKTF